MMNGREWRDHSVWSRPNYPTDEFRPLHIPGGGGGGSGGWWRVTSSRRPKIVFYVPKLLVRVPMNRLDLEKLLGLLVTFSKAIYQKPKYLRCGEVALR
jgi:hypothetical protein